MLVHHSVFRQLLLQLVDVEVDLVDVSVEIFGLLFNPIPDFGFLVDLVNFLVVLSHCCQNPSILSASIFSDTSILSD